LFFATVEGKAMNHFFGQLEAVDRHGAWFMQALAARGCDPPRILGFIRRHMPRRLQSSMDEEDVLQEAFALAWSHRTDFKKRSFEPDRWFRIVSLNIICNALRRFNRSVGARKRIRRLSGLIPLFPSQTPDEIATAQETSENVVRALKELRSADRSLFTEVRSEKFAVADAARRRGISAMAASRKLYRIELKLRRLLKSFRRR
jgi:RNA polymerase sigma factor (sigma-70 family)